MSNTQDVGVLKTLIDSVGRLKVANAIGMAYATLSAKLNGYQSFLPGEMDTAEKAAKEIREKELALNGATESVG